MAPCFLWVLVKHREVSAWFSSEEQTKELARGCDVYTGWHTHYIHTDTHTPSLSLAQTHTRMCGRCGSFRPDAACANVNVFPSFIQLIFSNIFLSLYPPPTFFSSLPPSVQFHSRRNSMSQSLLDEAGLVWNMLSVFSLAWRQGYPEEPPSFYRFVLLQVSFLFVVGLSDQCLLRVIVC